MATKAKPKFKKPGMKRRQIHWALPDGTYGVVEKGKSVVMGKMALSRKNSKEYEEEIQKLITEIARLKAILKEPMTAHQREFRAYKCGLADGYVHATYERREDISDGMDGMDALYKESNAFADNNGEAFFKDYVLDVAYNEDGTRSTGYVVKGSAFDYHGKPQPNTFKEKPAYKTLVKKFG
jgi:hypothetical protein